MSSDLKTKGKKNGKEPVVVSDEDDVGSDNGSASPPPTKKRAAGGGEKKPRSKKAKKEEPELTPGELARKAAYHKRMSRPGPTALGSKKMPLGSPGCFAGQSFIITGVLSSFARDQVEAVIEKYGGKIVKSLSGKTTYLIVGADPGDAKIDKAKKIGTTQLTEDGFLDLLRSTNPEANKTEEKAEDEDDAGEEEEDEDDEDYEGAEEGEGEEDDDGGEDDDDDSEGGEEEEEEGSD